MSEKLVELLEEMRVCVDDMVLEVYLNQMIANDSGGDDFARELARARTAGFLTDYTKALQLTFNKLEDALHSGDSAELPQIRSA